MKTISPALQNLLASRQFYSADLYQFTLVGGGVLRYCGGDADIRWNGVTWSAGGSVGPYFERKDSKAQCHWKVGLEVDTLTFDVLPGSATVLGEPLLSAVRQGQFDGADFVLYRAFMPTYGNTSDGTVLMFAGRVATIDASRSLATFTINSHLELLNQHLPRNLYQAGCLNTLYDSACGVVKNFYGSFGSVVAASADQITTSGFSQPAGYFDLGILTFTDGANRGISRTIKNWGTTPTQTFHLVSPFPVIASQYDDFKVYAGCDKQQSTCANKFNNLGNFRGFPYIPDSATAV